MNITSHPVAPEKVMALLDGELSAADLEIISSHVDQCAECSRLVEQLHSTSQSLSAWDVPAISKRLEDSIEGQISGSGLNRYRGRTGRFFLLSSWSWKRWAIASGGTLAVSVLLLAAFWPSLLRSRVLLFTQPALEEQRKVKKIAERPQFYAGAVVVPESKKNAGVMGAVDSLSPADDLHALPDQIGGHAQFSLAIDGPPQTDQRRESSSQAAPAPMIARTASLVIVIKDLAASRAALDTILARYRGYPAQLTVNTPENAARSIQASLRIPVSELPSAIGNLKALGQVINESQSGEEVTQQHTDLVARLKNARDTEQRFRTILQQRTGDVSEVLQVEEGIARVRGDIERMEAEQKELEHRVDFSTIELQLMEEYKAQLNPPVTPFSTRMHNALVAGYHHISETALGIVLLLVEFAPIVLVWLLILVLPVILVWRRILFRRSMSRRNS